MQEIVFIVFTFQGIWGWFDKFKFGINYSEASIYLQTLSQKNVPQQPINSVFISHWKLKATIMHYSQGKRSEYGEVRTFWNLLTAYIGMWNQPNIKITIRTVMYMSLWPTHTVKMQSRWRRKQRCWKSSSTENTRKWWFSRQTGVLKRRLFGIVAASGTWLPETQLHYRCSEYQIWVLIDYRYWNWVLWNNQEV